MMKYSWMYIFNKILIKYYYIKTQTWYKFFLKKSGEKNLIIRPIIITPEVIELHNYIFIRNNARIEGVKQYLDLKFQPKIIIEDNVSIEQNIHLTCAQSVSIGKNTAIAANVTITDIHHSYLNNSYELQSL